MKSILPLADWHLAGTAAFYLALALAFLIPVPSLFILGPFLAIIGSYVGLVPLSVIRVYIANTNDTAAGNGHMLAALVIIALVLGAVGLISLVKMKQSGSYAPFWYFFLALAWTVAIGDLFLARRPAVLIPPFLLQPVLLSASLYLLFQNNRSSRGR